MLGCHYVDLDFDSDKDVHEVARLHCECPAEWQPGYAFSASTLKKTVDDLQKVGLHEQRVILVRSQVDTILGLHWLRYNPDSETKTGEILSLWVHPGWRGNGIARKLKAMGEQWLQVSGARKVRTKVHIENDKMQTINKNMGYSVVMVGMEKQLV